MFLVEPKWAVVPGRRDQTIGIRSRKSFWSVD